ncbi:unnamed protein product [Jaminaea pallidilutea]
MAKKKKHQLEAWCWYCDREFEDDNVLLQHQKAKHYKCPYCPRRLNTAGGLTVHLHQVHKAEPTKIENALPGRDSFDIEIYGMVGIPEADLAEWRSRKAGSGRSSGQPAAKRQRVENVAMTPEQLKAQLEAHKALMSGHAPPPGSMAPPGFPSAPQPGFPPPYGGPPPSGYPSGPPPGYGGSPPPPVMGYPAGPPPPMGQQPGLPPPRQWGPPPNITVPQPSPHQIAVQSGAKSRMVYTDTAMSPEEKMASSSKYAYVDPDDPPLAADQAQQQASSSNNYGQWQQYAGGPPPPHLQHTQPPPPVQYGGSPHSGAVGAYPYQHHQNGNPYPNPAANSPPPPMPGQGASSTPYGSGPPPGQPPYSGPPPPPPSMPQQGYGYGSSSSSGHNGSQQPEQAYPAVPPAASPPAARPEANTAEALAATNENVAASAAGDAVAPPGREADVEEMESKRETTREGDAQEADVVPDTEAGEGGSAAPAAAAAATKPGGPKRARAADLF